MPGRGYKADSTDHLTLFDIKLGTKYLIGLQGQRFFLSFTFIRARSLYFIYGSSYFPEIITWGVLISQEISTGGVLIFGEYLFSVTGGLNIRDGWENFKTFISGGSK